MTGKQPHTQSPASPSFARVSLLIYFLLIVYASWYPFAGWHDNGISAFAYLKASLPYYWTMFDVWINLVGYMPLGLLMVLAMPRSHKLSIVWTVLLASLGGILTSATIEAVQTFLPTRIADKLDLLTNSIGAVLGALLGAFLQSRFGPQNRLTQLRQYWFKSNAGHGMAAIALWPLAQIYPLRYLFGFGQFTSMLSNWLSNWLEQPLDLTMWMTQNIQWSVEQSWLSETIITACGLIGATLTFTIILRKQAPKIRLTLLLICLTLMTKTLATALLFMPNNAFIWLTPGAIGGLLIGSLVLGGLSFVQLPVQRRTAALALIITLLLVNVIPNNPYYTATLQTWSQGKFLNFNGVAQFLSLLWPFFTLWFLLHPIHRIKVR